MEECDWLHSGSLEGADWLLPARWPPLICTLRCESASRLLPTAPTLIGCLSTDLMDTVSAMTRHSYYTRKSGFDTFHTFENVVLFQSITKVQDLG